MGNLTPFRRRKDAGVLKGTMTTDIVLPVHGHAINPSGKGVLPASNSVCAFGNKRGKS